MADLALFFKCISSLEQEIDQVRLRITESEGIDIIDIFNLINKGKSLGISKSTLSNFLKTQGIPYTLDSINAFFKYYSSSSKTDNLIYLTDIKIMMTPSCPQSQKSFHIATNEEDYTNEQKDLIKLFFELELSSFERLSKCALNFSHYEFWDVWQTIFIGVREPSQHFSAEDLRRFMREFGFDVSDFEWTLIVRRIVNNPVIRIREISILEFKLFIKVFRSDYESNKEQIIQELLRRSGPPIQRPTSSLLRHADKVNKSHLASNYMLIKDERLNQGLERMKRYYTMNKSVEGQIEDKGNIYNRYISSNGASAKKSPGQRKISEALEYVPEQEKSDSEFTNSMDDKDLFTFDESLLFCDEFGEGSLAKEDLRQHHVKRHPKVLDPNGFMKSRKEFHNVINISEHKPLGDSSRNYKHKKSKLEIDNQRIIPELKSQIRESIERSRISYVPKQIHQDQTEYSLSTCVYRPSSNGQHYKKKYCPYDYLDEAIIKRSEDDIVERISKSIMAKFKEQIQDEGPIPIEKYRVRRSDMKKVDKENTCINSSKTLLRRSQSPAERPILFSNIADRRAKKNCRKANSTGRSVIVPRSTAASRLMQKRAKERMRKMRHN